MSHPTPAFSDEFEKRAPAEAKAWLQDVLKDLGQTFHQRRFYYAFSGSSRHVPRECDELARSLLLLLLSEQPRLVYQEALEALLGAADLREAAAIYRTFPYLPDPEFLVPLARDGLRTNITSVFDALAHDNPFPADHFDEEGWNQMVLKCFFTDRPTHPILGIDERANESLALALSNYAHERWAAGRPVRPDLWRCCRRFLTDDLLEDLRKAAEDEASRDAVALTIAGLTDDRLDTLKESLKENLKRVTQGKLSWKTIAE
ncbi:MAG: EboA domain-containing protein [Verrucomicrobiota bacterium]